MQANGIAQAVFFSCLLVAAALWDIRKRTIPDSICILIALTGLIDFSPVNLLGATPALLFFFFAFLNTEYVGGGDIKLVAAVGSVMGLQAMTAGLIFSLVPFLLYWPAAAAVQRHRKSEASLSLRVAVPFIPLLSIGLLTAYYMKIGGIF